MQRQTTNMREAVSVQKGSTVNTIHREFCDIVVEALEDQWVRMLAADEMTHHIREFYAVTGFPQAFGALDGCHFPVSPPKENAVDYYNYKGWYSGILLALVDHKYCFQYINVGSPGRCHDAHVYHSSSLPSIVTGPTFRSPTISVQFCCATIIIM
ncbi:hypothetical protein MRX96_040356 [Rhipicephalus microplus]